MMIMPLFISQRELDSEWCYCSWMDSTKAVRQKYGLEENISERWGSWRERRAQFSEVAHLYDDPARGYHTLQHIAAGFSDLKNVWRLAEDPLAIAIAWFHHDAIYDAKVKDNEEKSAALLRAHCTTLHFPGEFTQQAVDLVLITKHFEPTSSSPTIDEQIMLDTDLAILGSSPANFRGYCAGIQREYQWVIDQFGKDFYQQRRAGKLESFLNLSKKDGIYHLPYFREKYEAQARVNLETEITSLQKKASRPDSGSEA